MMRYHNRILTAILCAAVPFCGVTTAVGQPPVRRVALLVGVNEYDKRGLAERPLQFAERDVQVTATVLERQGFQVQVLTGGASGARRATRDGILAALERMLKGLNARDIVLLGFAGHGQQMPVVDEQGRPVRNREGKVQEDAFFCPVDTLQENQSTMISLAELTATLGRRGGVNLILVDACRDDPDRGRGARSITGNELNGLLPAKTAIVFSCAAGQRALETRSADNGHGVFFCHVIRGLQGAAAKRNGDVTWGSLIEYIGDHTNQRACEWFPSLAERAPGGRLQTPHELRNMTSDVNPVLARTSGPGKMTGHAAGALRDDNGLQLALVWIPAGSFTMGSPNSEVDRFPRDESPVTVRLSSGFWTGRNEVTRAQWKTLLDSEPWGSASRACDDCPATHVDWNDAIHFCDALTTTEREAGRLPPEWHFTLPTEAQWEYACRAGTGGRFNSGDSVQDLKTVAWFGGFDGSGTAREEPHVHPVGHFKANPWGLFDTHGNVWEWCRDSFVESRKADRNPLVDSPGAKRVHRGGSWGTTAQHCRSANRGRSLPAFREDDLGFRVVCEPVGMHPARQQN